MSNPLVGAVAGLLLALVQYPFLSRIADKLQKDGVNAQGARLVRGVAQADFVLLPVVGYFIGRSF